MPHHRRVLHGQIRQRLHLRVKHFIRLLVHGLLVRRDVKEHEDQHADQTRQHDAQQNLFVMFFEEFHFNFSAAVSRDSPPV